MVHGKDLVVELGQLVDVAIVISALEVAAAAIGAVFLEPAVASSVA
jgi:hypothetical protein